MSERKIGVKVGRNTAEIWNAAQKLSFVRDSPRETLSLKSFIRIGDRWLTFSDGDNCVADGANFNLRASSCRIRAQTRNHVRLEASGIKQNALSTSGDRFSYNWTTNIDAFSNLAWMKVTTLIRLPADLQLAEPEPQLLLNFHGESKDDLLLESTGSNDMPSMYYWVQTKKGEVVFLLDATPMKWMSKQNMRRFKDYHCSSRTTEKDGQKENHIGLLAASKSGSVIPRGNLVLSYWLLQNYRREKPTEWDALNFMVTNALDLLESTATMPSCASSWEKFASGCVRDLGKDYYCLTDLKGIRGYRAYVAETSLEFGGEKATVDSLEYITLTDVIWPSLLYLKVKHNKKHGGNLRRLIAELPFWHDSENHIMYNGFDGEFVPNSLRIKPEKIGDTWYFFQNGLIKTAWIAYLTGDKKLEEMFLDACIGAVEYAHNVDYDFPVFYDSATLKPSKERDTGFEFATAGLYAYAMILAHKLRPEKEYVDEAAEALKKMHSHSVNSLCYEPQFFAFSALAADHLYSLLQNRMYLDYANDFLNAELKMMYWYDDKTEPSMKYYNTKGLFRACPPYPAFKENVEAILPWTGLFARTITNDGFLNVLNLARINNFYHFSPCLPKKIHPSRKPLCEYIPYENLHMLEDDFALGRIGKEIYGAGETLWMYLMFEALGYSSDGEILTFNTDLLNLDLIRQFPYFDKRFILYNPTEKLRSFEFRVKAQPGTPYDVLFQDINRKAIEKRHAQTKKETLNLQISLEPKQFLYCVVNKRRG